MLMTLPPWSRIHALTTWRVSRIGPMTLTSQILLIAPSSASRMGPYCGLVAALFTRTSTRPSCRITSETTASQVAASPTWPGTAIARPPEATISAAAASHASAWRALSRDRRPRLGKDTGNRQPDAAASTGDQSDPAVEGEALRDAHGQLRLEVPAWSFDRTSMRSSSAASRLSSRRQAARRSAVPSISRSCWRWAVSTCIAAATM